MLRNYILITLRSIARNKIFILINVFGLGIAVACCIVGYLIWDFSGSFDKNHSKAESIYRIQSYQDYQGQRNRFATAPTPLGPIIRQNFSDVDNVVRYTSTQGNFRVGDEVFSSSVAYADSAFFDLFTFTLKSGTFSSLHDKSQILISDELARKYFDTEEVIGRQITQINNGVLKEFLIGGVFAEQPLNSSFGFQAITLWENCWDAMGEIESHDSDWKAMSTLFIQVNDKATIPGLTKQLQAFIEPQNKSREDLKLSEYYLQNFSTLAANFYGDTWLSGEQLRWGLIPSAVIGPAVMAIFLLLLACFNFTNTSIAISGRRLKEIGVRKTMGGLRGQLIFQFLSESLVLCFMALIVGLLIAEFLVPMYNDMWPGIKLTLSYSENIAFFIFLVSLLILMALIAGTYPAFYVTSFKPVSILKGKLTFGGTNWFTRTLLTLQLVISLLCIISSVAYVRNASYQRDFDLGYSKDGIIVAKVNGEAEFNAFRNALTMNKDVLAIAGSKDHVSDKYYRQPVKHEGTEHQVEIVDIGDDYLKTMNVTLLEGREFIKDSKNDRNESVIVSKTFVNEFGLDGNALGKRLLLADSLQLFIIGVVPDILTDGFWKPAAPVMLRYVAPHEYTQIVVSTTPANLLSVNDFMVETWKKISPNTLYNGKHVDSNLYVAQLINTNAVRICVFLGIIAALMSATALFALVSLNILKKRKELGVRKVLGASIANIIRVINMEFMLILAVASALGSVAGYFLTDIGMDAIWEHYLPINIITLVICVGLLMIIAMITVGYKTISTARTNPVESLREE
jgi:ABC-type antimicrobial peptide transport system permease subunit